MSNQDVARGRTVWAALRGVLSPRLTLVIALLLPACGPALGAPCAEPPDVRTASRAPEPSAQDPEPIRVAVTIDDLPGGYDALPGRPKSRMMSALIATLEAHQITPVGFVNGIYADGDADALAGLRSWLEAGFEIGNHTYSHQSARALSVEAFLGDVRKNGAFLQSVAPERPVRYFRFPYLERGNEASQRIAITEALAQDGYRVATVSVDFADWAFAPAFARCLARDDRRALDALREAYLQNASAALFWSAESTTRLFGRAVPQVLLLHAHAATAENLDALLTSYEQAGVRWITLEEALRDPAYAEPPERDHGDTSLVFETMRSTDVKIASFVPRSLSLLELACR